MRRRPSVIVVTGALALSVLCFSAPAGGSVARATNPADATATAKPLVNQYFTLVQKKDTVGLKKFLSPAFELQRADGSGAGKSDFLASLPTVQTFTLSGFTATRTGDVLVVRYLADATGIVNGKPYAPGPAPRLSVFARTGNRWQIVAHANFNPLTG